MTMRHRYLSTTPMGRFLRVCGIFVAVLATAGIGWASPTSPPDGTLTLDQRRLEFIGGPTTGANVSPQVEHVCPTGVLECDVYELTINLPDNLQTTNPGSRLRIVVEWPNPDYDFDIYLVDTETGETVGTAASANDPEVIDIEAPEGTGEYHVDIVPFTTVEENYAGSVELVLGDPAQDDDTEPTPDYGDFPSAPGKPRVIVSVIDTAINPYHEFYYQHPSTVTAEVLAELGVKPENVVELTRTGNFSADFAADAAFWNNVQRGELYHFVGTNIIAASLGGPDIQPLAPLASKSPHGVGTSSSVLAANPEAIIFFVETEGALGNRAAHELVLRHPAVDMLNTSYGIAIQGLVGVLPETRAFHETYEGVVERGKLHFTSAGNNPGFVPTSSGAGPWWSIGVSGVEEDKSGFLTEDGQAQQFMSGNFPDFVGDFTQQLPYCHECESGITGNVPGTSFSSPRATGVASRVLLEARRALGHAGGITEVDGQMVMAAGGGRSISNWFLRRALEQAAWIPRTEDYSPFGYITWEVISLPVNPVAPWLQVAWGELTTKEEKGVIPAALWHLGFAGEPRDKTIGFCEFQTEIIQIRRLWWEEVAPTIPINYTSNDGVSGGGDPFIYCASNLPHHPESNDPGGHGPSSMIDDSDPAIEYRRGWHLKEDAAASNGGYHRRMGNPRGGEAATARLVFEGDAITYFFARSQQGGTADVFIDGAPAATVDYYGPAHGDAPEFGHSMVFDGLGEGSHEILIAHNSGAAYIDGFELGSGDGGSVDLAAAATRSLTTTFFGELLNGLGLVETVQVGDADEWLSVVVEGADEPLSVYLFDPLGRLAAEGDLLVDGSNAVGFDIAPTMSGTYTIQVLDTLGVPAVVEISISRTAVVQ